VSKRSLFVSFAESDGGHSYLAARAMLDPASIAHLIFRNTVAESLEAVAAGQANYAIVPAYNSITQWDGATLKALSTGQYEICAQVCMPTSYVLVAHKDLMSEFVTTYGSVKGKDPNSVPGDEEAAKIYTRFLSRIFVGAQAEEQYRGRLIRPDMTHATIELSRNPLRILEELTRSDLLKAMTATPRHAGVQPMPQPQAQPMGVGATPYLQPITSVVQQPTPVMEMMQAPAALVAAGLLDAPGDPDGWDQPGSLGEIVSLLRKLLVLLNVYSFGSPDLPENKTQYLMLGRRGLGIPGGAVKAPAAAPTRLMVLVKPTLKKSSADQWQKPRAHLAKRARDFGFVFDRPPLMLSPGNQRVFLLEGGKPKEGVFPNPIGALERLFSWLADTFGPADGKSGKAGPTTKDKSLRKALEKRPEGMRDDTPGRYDLQFLGQYSTWCHGLSDESCWCCDEAHAETAIEGGPGLGTILIATLVALTVLALLLGPAYCAITGSCSWFGTPSQSLPPTIESPNAPSPPAPPPPSESSYPGLSQTTPPAAAPPPAADAPTTAEPPTASPSAPPTPRIEAPRMPIFHVAFFETKANLTVEALNSLGAAASQSMQLNKPVMVRVVALGPRENDEGLWQRRLYAVKDELVRLGVPADRVRHEGNGPYVVTIRNTHVRPSDTEFVPDAMSGD